MTEIYEMLAKLSNGENSRGRNHEFEGENSFREDVNQQSPHGM